MFKSSSSSQLSLLEEVNARSGPGVVLVDPCAAKPFLGIPPLVQHELGMVVFGANCPSQDANTCQPISVPATTSEGSKVIVSACLHQVGSTKVLMAHHHENRIALPDSQVLVFTTYRDEADPDAWNKLCARPVGEICDQFKQGKKLLLGPPWARSWKSGKKKCSPDQAEQFSFLGRVPSDSLEVFCDSLGSMGCTFSSTNPWRVIWLHRSRQEVMLEARKLPDQVGLARSPKFGVGIRVPSKSFGDHFQKLRPGDDIPHDITGQTVYKIQPCPPRLSRTDGASLRTWLSQRGWNAKPLRALGRDTWLIASAEEPPKEAWP